MRRGLRDFYLTVDLRSLGLYRVLLASLLVWDFATRWPDLEAFYTSFGALPVEADLPRSGGEFHFCLLDGVTSLTLVRAVFGAGLVFYLLLLVGYRTRLFGILSFIFFTSVISRAVLLRDGSVVVLATMLLWSLFLPMGQRFSLDRLFERMRHPPPPEPASANLRSQPSLAALAIVAQIGLIYFFTAAAKYGATWKDGTALYYALNVDQLARPLGQWLATQPLGLLKALTWSTLVMEFGALPLLLTPVGQPWLRRIAIVGLTSLHLGIALTTTLSFFSATMVSTYALLLLPEDWEWLHTLPAARRVRRLADHLRAKTRRWLFPGVAASGTPATNAGTAASTLPGCLPSGPQGGRRESLPGEPCSPAWWERTMAVLANAGVALLFVAFTLDGYNLNLTKRLGLERIPEPRWVRAIILVPALPHDWELFAPNPSKDDGWWVIDGETESGAPFDPLTGKAPTSDKPRDLAFRFDRLWRKYLDRIWLKKNYEYRLPFGKYITRENHRDKPEGERLARFNFYYVKETTQPPGTPQPWPTERMLLWHHECFRSSKPGPNAEPAPDQE